MVLVITYFLFLLIELKGALTISNLATGKVLDI